MNKCCDDNQTLQVDNVTSNACPRADRERDTVVAQILRVGLEPTLGAELVRVGENGRVVVKRDNGNGNGGATCHDSVSMKQDVVPNDQAYLG